MQIEITRHAETRMQQRGYRPTDIDTVLASGIETRNGFLLTRQQVTEEIAALKRQITLLQRLMNTFVVTDGGKIVTIYRCKSRRSDAVRRGER